MAVQKSKKSRSRRDMRRSHDSLTASSVSSDATTGSKHLRHHIAKDLKNIAISARKGFSVDIEQIPTRPKFDKFITSKYKEECILGGGEDYELCFTANNKYSNKISSISNKLKLNITKIGRITNNGYEYLSGDKVINIKSEGYDHFKK